jgi:hypothetical protein
MDRELFLKGMDFCKRHASCAKCCPLHDECNGSYDMLYKTFSYVDELTKENEKLRRENDECHR